MRPIAYGPMSSDSAAVFYDAQVTDLNKAVLNFVLLAEHLKNLLKGTEALGRFQSALCNASSFADIAWSCSVDAYQQAINGGSKEAILQARREKDAASRELMDWIGIAALHDRLFDRHDGTGLTIVLAGADRAKNLLEYCAARFNESYPNVEERRYWASAHITLYGDVVGIDKLDFVANHEQLNSILTFTRDTFPWLFACGVDVARRDRNLSTSYAPLDATTIAARYLDGFVVAGIFKESLAYCHDQPGLFDSLNSKGSLNAIIPRIRNNLVVPAISQNRDGLALIKSMEEVYDRITALKAESKFIGVMRDWPIWDRFLTYTFDQTRAPRLTEKYGKFLPKRVQEIIKWGEKTSGIKSKTAGAITQKKKEDTAENPSRGFIPRNTALSEPILRQLPDIYIHFRNAVGADMKRLTPKAAIHRAIFLSHVRRHRRPHRSPH